MNKRENKRKLVRAILLLTLPTLVVLIIVVVLMYWRIPTRVKVELIVEQAIFTVGGTTPIPMVESVGFHSITVEKFSSIEFHPESLEIAKPDEYPKLVWESFTFTVTSPKVKITGKDKALEPSQIWQPPVVTLEFAESQTNALGNLNQIQVDPGSEVILELRGSQTEDITIKIEGQKSFVDLSIGEQFQLTTDFCVINGITGLSYDADFLIYRAKLSERSPFAQISSQPDSLVLSLTLSPDNVSEIFYTGNIPVTSIGSSVPFLVKYGTITYPEYLKIGGVLLGDLDFIKFGQLKKFSIEKISMAQERKGIQLLLNGIAADVRTGPLEFLKDRRLTYFDVFWQYSLLVVLFGIIIWGLPTALGGYNLYQETVTPFKKQITEFQKETEFTFQETVNPLKKQMAEFQKDIQVVFNFMELFPRKNPYVVGSPVIDKEMFFGRSEIINKILHGIHNNHYYILGEQRSGKTSLLKRLAEEIGDIQHPDYVFQTILVDFQTLSEETFFKTLSQEFLKSIDKLRYTFQLTELSRTTDSDFTSQIEEARCSDDFIDLFSQLYDVIYSEISKPVIFVLIMDEFDKINGFNVTLKEEFRSIFMQRETVEYIRLIAAGGKLELWDRSSPFNFMIELDISRLSQEDARRLILKPSRNVVIWDEKVVDKILEFSEGKPYEIQKQCFSLVNYVLENRIFKITNSVLNDFLTQQKQ